MIVVTIWDIIIFVIIGIAILLSIITAITEETKKIGKKNCYECKHYKLHDVASCGDGCWYKCTKHNRKDSCVSMNETEHYEKCKFFTNKGEGVKE